MIGAHVALQLLQRGKPVTAIRRANSDTTRTRTLFSYYTPHYQQLFDRITWLDAAGDTTVQALRALG